MKQLVRTMVAVIVRLKRAPMQKRAGRIANRALNRLVGTRG
jgi:hypothetical protein